VAAANATTKPKPLKPNRTKPNQTKPKQHQTKQTPPRSGSPLDPECPPEAAKLSPTAAALLVIDTNVALHQLDFLEHPAVTDVIVTKTVLEEVG
jgi:hypothetical protein